jgi:hypothetical protein
MTVKKRTNLTLAVTILTLNVGVVLVTGCSKDMVVDSLLYDSRPSIDGMMIEYPPSRIIYHGKMTEKNERFIIRCLRQMHTQSYKNYTFKDNISLTGGITTVRTETDSDSNDMNTNSSK